jgi:PAS domain S-box-containing protein
VTTPGGDPVTGGRRFRSLDDPETLLLIVQNLEEGIYITNASGDILDANPAFLRMFGVSAVGELAKFRSGDLIADPTRRALEMALLERDGAVRDFELAIVRPDGQRRTVLDTTYVCRDPETGETFYHGILIDITRRKELEIQLREQSIRDALTGCYNRRYLLDFGDRMTEDKVSQWGCIYIDIDHFKAYNDLHGHKKGDRVLVQMSRFLMR